MTSSPWTARRVMLVAGALLLAPGCWRTNPPAVKIGHYLRSPASVRRLNRVVFVALRPQAGTDRIANGMTEALASQIREKGLFHIDVIGNDDPACQDLPLTSRQAFTMKELAQMRDALQCDAVLIGTVNYFRPYPRMQIGIYVRLLDLRNGQLVWGIDQVWDTTDQLTRQRAKRYFSDKKGFSYIHAYHDLSMMSPRTFEEFIAYEAAGTLPDPGGQTPAGVSNREKYSKKTASPASKLRK